MENNNKYNKRRRSITEFRTSYSDNKKYFISTDKTARWQPIVKYLIIAAIIAAITLVSFVVTDALLEISEAPYITEETTTQSTTQLLDDDIFEGQVTIPADQIDDLENN